MRMMRIAKNCRMAIPSGYPTQATNAWSLFANQSTLKKNVSSRMQIKCKFLKALASNKMAATFPNN